MDKQYTASEIADRFEEAALTLRRLPKVGIRGYASAMPSIVRTAAEIEQGDKLPMRLGPPKADAISRMEEVLDWIWWLDDEDERRLVWLRAEGVIWKRICWRIGCGRTKAWQMWSCALLKIATRLNANNGGQ